MKWENNCLKSPINEYSTWIWGFMQRPEGTTWWRAMVWEGGMNGGCWSAEQIFDRREEASIQISASSDRLFRIHFLP